MTASQATLPFQPAVTLESVATAATASEAVEHIFEYYKPDNYKEKTTVQRIDWLADKYRAILEGKAAADKTYATNKRVLFEILGFNQDQTEDLVIAWGNKRKPTDVSREEWIEARVDQVRQNIQTMDILNRIQPGAAVQLYNDYGIRNFAAYGIFQLWEQLGGTTERPVKLAAASAFDWNGSYSGKFSRSHEADDILNDDYVVVESRTPLELLKHCLAVSKKFGPIDTVLIQAHGTSRIIEMGQGTITDTDISQTKIVERLIDRHVLDPQVEIILMACDAQELAQAASEQTRGRVSAPGKMLVDFAVNSKGKLSNFDSETGKKTPFKTYEQGELTKTFRQTLRDLGRKILSL